MTTDTTPTAEPPPAPTFDRERESVHRQMLSSVSHDLKTPLASIIGALEVHVRMKDKLPVEKQQALISVALQEAYRLDAFVTNVLDMARLENGLVKPKPETVEIDAMLRGCLARMQYHLRDSTIEIRDPAEPVEAKTDAALLSRVVSLVLDNAVKYGGRPSVLHIETGRDGPRSGLIRIRDNGPGIPEGRIETIFRKYVRLNGDNQQNAGAGLGLPIARAIMRLLNGNIAAANLAEGGAVFTLSFPLS